MALTGDVANSTVGADAARSRWLGGVAVSHSLGYGPYRAGGRGHGDLDSALITVLPYLRFAVNDRLTAWGTVGYGDGSVDLRTDGVADAFETDIALRTAAAETTGNLTATLSATSRVRFVLEGSRPFDVGAGRMLTPTVKFSVRHDGGDAEPGAGGEFGGSLGYADVARGDAAYRKWCASATVRLDPGTAGRMTLSLSPEWGAAGVGAAERLWSVRDAGDLAHGYGFDAGMRLAAESGYGLNAFRGRGTMTLFLGTRGGAGGPGLRLGGGWTLGEALRFGVDATRSGFAPVSADHGGRLSATACW